MHPPPITTQTPLAVAIGESGLRQDWIAARLGVSKATVSRWVAGKSIPLKTHQFHLALLLRRSVEELFPASAVAA